ncbi:MAG TPA: threonine--tRNA ligase [Candidatus Paceibacterota bacterium]|nr:threonine--tRNA ligase [Candidatus Paceibacterota bacterium]
MENIESVRHSLAHLLAAAVLEHYPNARPTIGPAVDNGFYYDFEFAEPISEKDLNKIEKSMRKIAKGWTTFERLEVTAAEARERFAANPFKLELIDDIEAKGEAVTLYKSGDFTDLCRGGHVGNMQTVDLEGFKLERLAGAYWRGDESNKQLTRIYGLAFPSKSELEAYVLQIEEAKKRDHRVLGKQLKIFTISDLIGPGLPLMQPNGMLIRQTIENYLWELHADKGYSRVWTPHIAKEALYETSGHAAKFGDELFRVQGKEDKFIMKPMNCPHHMQIFADNQFSYRDMPIRYFEPATVYRDEKSGQLAGLTRVRAITQDDGHLFCRVSQIKDEVKTITDIIKRFYATMGMMDGYWVSLSVRGEDKSLYLGSDEIWTAAEEALEEAAKANDLPYKRVEGEAAFYGPKLDFMFKDAIGRQWQLATIQCDFNLPERFDLSFINESGEKERPVVIHRAISGSLERFMGIMIEHFAGAFPTWLSPLQVIVLPVSEKHQAYAQQVQEVLRSAGVRAEASLENETLGKKIRGAKTRKIPYLLVVGDKEAESGTITVEKRGTEKGQAMDLDRFVAAITQEIQGRSL